MDKRQQAAVSKVLMCSAIILFGGTVIACEYDYAQYEPIDCEITSPADNTYKTINSTTNLYCTAVDKDYERWRWTGGEWSDWYMYLDEVQRGGSYDDYHIVWTCSGGGEIVEATKYGTEATYAAPDYSEGSSVRNVTIKARADDFDRGEETPTDAGYKEDADEDTITLKVWQVHVGGRISGSVSSNYDGASIPSSYGGGQLGWLSFGSPSGTEGFFAGIELKGTVPSGPGVTGYEWYNYKKGIVRHKETSTEPNWKAPPDYQWSNYVFDFGPSYSYADGDSRHPDVTGPDCREVFAIDAPGFWTGASNNGSIPPWTYYDYDIDFKAWVEVGAIRVSNECLWQVDFDLEEDSGTWSEVNHAIATDS